jgi:hypothetical protein
MSIKAIVEASCPGGCEPAEFEVWSFIRGDRDENLRDRILVGELNLVVCGECSRHFSPEAPLVYLDPTVDLLAFVFPKSYEKESERWQRKMHEDFDQLRSAYKDAISEALQPIELYGMERLTELLQEEDSLEDEVQVAEYYCGELSLPVVRIGRGFARARQLPYIVPAAGGRFSRDAARDGVKALLKANDRLAAFERWLSFLDSDEPDPPAEETS